MWRSLGQFHGGSSNHAVHTGPDDWLTTAKRWGPEARATMGKETSPLLIVAGRLIARSKEETLNSSYCCEHTNRGRISGSGIIIICPVVGPHHALGIVNICAYTHIYTYVHSCICIHVHIHSFTCVHVCVHM